MEKQFKLGDRVIVFGFAGEVTDTTEAPNEYGVTFDAHGATYAVPSEVIDSFSKKVRLDEIKAYDEQNENFIITLRKMGFKSIEDGSDILRLDEQGTVAEVVIDEADNALVDGVWLYENYDNPFHKRLMAYQREIGSVGDVVCFLNYFVPQKSKEVIAKINATL